MRDNKKSILLYLETCCVDQSGRVEAKRMNQQDFDDIDLLKKDGLIEEFKRIKFHEIERLHKVIPTKRYTYTVDLTDEGWKQAHLYRKERGKRMIAKLANEEGKH